MMKKQWTKLTAATLGTLIGLTLLDAFTFGVALGPLLVAVAVLAVVLLYQLRGLLVLRLPRRSKPTTLAMMVPYILLADVAGMLLGLAFSYGTGRPVSWVTYAASAMFPLLFLFVVALQTQPDDQRR